jgi:hypothetical protein
VVTATHFMGFSLEFADELTLPHLHKKLGCAAQQI